MHCGVLGDLPRGCPSPASKAVTWVHMLVPARASLYSLRVKNVRIFSHNCCKLRGEFRWQRVFVVKSQAKESGEDEEGGDQKVQDLLVEMVRLETGKIRVSDFVEERRKLLTDIAEQANEEYDRIAEVAKKSMDEAGFKVLEKMEADAQAFEEELALARAEIEANDRELDEFEINVQRARNDGLFFKGLYQPVRPLAPKTSEAKNDIKDNNNRVMNITKKNVGSSSRHALYGILIFLLSLTLLEALTWTTVQWPKIIVYVVVLVALITQLTFEIVSETKEKDEK